MTAPASRGAGPKRTAAEAQFGNSPLAVELCVAVVYSGDFVEVAASATGVGDALWSALSAFLPSPEQVATNRRELERRLAALPRKDPEALARMQLELLNANSQDGLLERSIRRLVEWFRGGGGDPPSSGPPVVPA